MLTEQQTACVSEIQDRRTQVSLNNFSSGREEADRAVAEATTQEDIDNLGDIFHGMPSDIQQFIWVFKEVWAEFGKYRCSVCGRTAEQSAAINYDCVRGC